MKRLKAKKEKEQAIDKASKMLLKMGPVPHKRPKKPTKEELNKRFKLVVDPKGNPFIKEVND